ncbi:MAG TPA: YrhB domain-containing protein [Longimicrobiaceae bacterium]|jgi:hypothetical protein
MIDREEAKRPAGELVRPRASAGIEVVILDDATIDKESGRVFFYPSKRFLETGRLGDTLPGDAPVLVLRADGSIRRLGTALPVETCLREYEAGGGRRDA